MQIACAKCAMRRCNNTIAEFDTLPDAALVNLKAIIALSCRSKSSIYRDIAAGRISSLSILAHSRCGGASVTYASTSQAKRLSNEFGHFFLSGAEYV